MNDEIQVLDTDTPINESTTYTPYERINFENGTLVSPGFINSETGELTMPVYSGKAPINAQNLNHLEDGIKNLENYVLVNGGGAGGGSSEPIGVVKAYAGTVIPDGYLLCDGRQVSKTEYGELFAVLGTAFNLSTDNDSTKFRIPDLRGRVVVGVGSFDTTHTFTLAKKGGEYEHLLTTAELPRSNVIFTQSGNGNFISTYTSSKNGPFSADETGGTAHNNIQPYLALNYIIKAVKTTTLVAEVEDSLESNSTVNAPSIYAAKEAFLSKGEVIYDNPNGSAISIKLTDDANKYEYIEIDAVSTILGVSVYLPTQRFKILNKSGDNYIFLSGTLPNVGSNLMINVVKGYILKNNTLSINTQNGYEAAVLNLGTNTLSKSSDGEIFITKIAGYK